MKNHARSAPIIFRPFLRFAQLEASGGILLIFCTLFALVWANSPWAHYYFELWETNFALTIETHSGVFKLKEPLELWVNDGLMAVFFFAVGLEIKREILVGELSSPRKAAMPIAAALGGMIVPALIFSFFNQGLDSSDGWGIPMATDIAFALGVLTLLGKRVPVSLKIFLTALAIVDDLGAVLVIAVFYTSKIIWLDLVLGGVVLLMLIGLNRAGVRHPLPYAILGIGGLWSAFFFSGVHATIAGVLAAFTIPARNRINSEQFLQRGEKIMKRFRDAGDSGKSTLPNEERLNDIDAMMTACEGVQAPLQSLERLLHPWVVFFILPVFAFANAGVAIKGDLWQSLTHPLTIGVFLGLFLGKQLGIFLFSFISVKLGLGSLPSQVTWKQIYGASILGGIGFTMSLFITSLAFKDPQLVGLIDISKLAILLSSLIAGIVGYFFLRTFSPIDYNKNLEHNENSTL